MKAVEIKAQKMLCWGNRTSKYGDFVQEYCDPTARVYRIGMTVKKEIVQRMGIVVCLGVATASLWV